MPEQQPESVKVYELAKELGLDSFALLDKLKSINIEVKSHMSSLASDQVAAVREAISGKKKSAAGGAATTKKRAAGAATAASAPTAAPSARKIVKKASAAAAAEPVAAKGDAEAPKRKVIKRRADTEETVAPSSEHEEQDFAPEADEATSDAYEAEEAPAEEVAEEESAPAPAVAAQAPEAEEESAEEVEAAAPAPVVEPKPEAAPAPKAAPVAAPAAKAASSPAAPVAPKTPGAPAPKTPGAPAPKADAPRRNLDQYTPRANAPGTKVIFRTPNNRPEKSAQKDELLDEFASRRLKIVSAAPPAPVRSTEGPAGPRPTYRTPGGPAGGVERRRTPGGPATPGAPGDNMFQPMTSYVSRGPGGGGSEDDRNKRGGGAGGSGTRGPTPEEIRVSDFRKRELVFQPKRKRLPPGKQVKRTEITEMAAHKKKVRIEDKIVVSELAQRMGEKGSLVVGKLMKMGTMAGLNQTIDFETASLIAAEFGWEVENVAFKEADVFEADAEDADLVERPPVITIMGHVDHGKTSLLDAIRNARVASGEAGGITQHIGAYSVEVNGKAITFLDTPGHEAFANMRSRGANLTDIVVLVVAADDSIMPQTKEAIAHATTAGVPMIVAANKIDKPSANLEKVKKDLSINNVLVEDWGGQVPMVGVSALTKEGIDVLLETIQLQAEVLELRANPDRAAEGIILEARMEKGRGVVADLLVNKGTLKTGDHIVVGTAYGRVRAMMNDRGKTITEVLPGFPAEIFGLNDVPSAGDTFNIVKSEAEAKEVAENRRQKILEEKAAASAPKMMTMDEILAKRDTGGVKELNLIIKADVFGSSEAIKESIEKIHSTKVRAKVLQSGVGVVTENDVLMAKTANAMIVGFNSKPDNKARDVAKREKVEIKFYSIIYQLLDDVRNAMENLLEPIRKETPMGRADVKQVFTVSKLGTVAGSIVADGKIARNAFARVTRGKDTVAEGKVVSLRRFKDDVSETIKGQECGIGVEGFDNYQPGDVINVFHVELVKQML